MHSHKYDVALIIMKKWKIDAEKGEIYTRQGLSTCVDVRGYPFVDTVYQGRKYRFKHHQIIVIAAGLDPRGLTVNHKDGNKLNNRIENLEVITSKENTQHAYDTGLAVPHNRKFTDAQVREIRNRCSNKELHKELSKEFQCCVEIIGRIFRRETYKNVI